MADSVAPRSEDPKLIRVINFKLTQHTKKYIFIVLYGRVAELFERPSCMPTVPQRHRRTYGQTDGRTDNLRQQYRASITFIAR